MKIHKFRAPDEWAALMVANAIERCGAEIFSITVHAASGLHTVWAKSFFSASEKELSHAYQQALADYRAELEAVMT